MLGLLLVHRGPQHDPQAAPEGLSWDVQIIPTYEGVERHNTVVGGASLWVLAGKSDEEYKAAAAYLAFLATKPEQQFLLENTGYIPVTKSTYQALLDEGFYAKEPFINRDMR